MARSQTFATLSRSIDGRPLVAAIIRNAVACPLCATTQQGSGYAVCPDCYRVNGALFTTQAHVETILVPGLRWDEQGRAVADPKATRRVRVGETIRDYAARQNAQRRWVRSAEYEPFPTVYSVGRLAEAGKPNAVRFVESRAHLTAVGEIARAAEAWIDGVAPYAATERLDEIVEVILAGPEDVAEEHTGILDRWSPKAVGARFQDATASRERTAESSVPARPHPQRTFEVEAQESDPYGAEFAPELQSIEARIASLRSDLRIARRHGLADEDSIAEALDAAYAERREIRDRVQRECRRSYRDEAIAPVNVREHLAQVDAWLRTLSPKERSQLGDLPEIEPSKEILPQGVSVERSTLPNVSALDDLTLEEAEDGALSAHFGDDAREVRLERRRRRKFVAKLRRRGAAIRAARRAGEEAEPNFGPLLAIGARYAATR